MPEIYNSKKIEQKWQELWENDKVFEVAANPQMLKKYVLVEFPYPSGAGLHMGHLRPYVAGDVYARYFRLKGENVLYPMGWDAFGLPAENYAIKNGVHPKITTAQNIANAKAQIKSWGVSFDWSREINTTDPEYYKWTQWIFLQLYKAGLAYQSTGLINWCPVDKTGLANEEVINGKCDRCGSLVEQKELKQWYLKITEYAEKLLRGLDGLNWPSSVVTQQKNWIGKSNGAEIKFNLNLREKSLAVFTTRPDTIFGATYLVVSPEHKLIKDLSSHVTNWQEVEEYISASKEKSIYDRTSDARQKTGVELGGIKAINPANGEEIPVWVADYVLASYGSGAIMAVPAHDERDHEFASKYDLPIVQVIEGPEEVLPTSLHGKLVNSGEFDGQNSQVAKEEIAKKFGILKTTYKLRDWVFSRQRYWGEPIPIIHCSKCGAVPVPEADLPVVLPEVEKYEPTGTGDSPLATIDEWVNVSCPACQGPAKRETDTMPQWAGSSWYYLRYVDPDNKTKFADMEKMKYWLPVDTYFGGMEHTTLHLLYSRFWHLFLYDQGVVPNPEPYTNRIVHGIILAGDGEKMSKSRGNVVNPDDIREKFGADSMRMYQLFLGPHEQQVSWNDQGIVGVHRFIEKTWRWVETHINDTSESKEAQIIINNLVRSISENIESIKFNVAVSDFMKTLNELKDYNVSRDSIRNFLILLSPFAPHIVEELNTKLESGKLITQHSWPIYDPSLVNTGSVMVMPVQINGKIRAQIEVPVGAEEQTINQLVESKAEIQKHLAGKQVKKMIIVKDKIISIVT